MGKVSRRFVEEMIYGIPARGSVRLSEIARSLAEKASLKKRIDRLQRNLGRSGLADEISEAVLADGSSRIDTDTLLIVNPTDITKKYAKKMECLAKVRDASEKEVGLGYQIRFGGWSSKRVFGDYPAGSPALFPEFGRFCQRE